MITLRSKSMLANNHLGTVETESMKANMYGFYGVLARKKKIR